MNLKQLEAFVQVSESGSFSRAAKELYLTQPTISAHIASLEKELSVRLFVRNTKEVGLSDDGKDLYKYARQIVDLEKKIEERFCAKDAGEKGCITIAASTIPAQYLLPKVLIRFNERYPDEQIKIIETDSSKVVTRIIDHMADVGFTGTVLEKKHCKYIPFYKDELVIITPNTEKYRKLKQESPDDVGWILKEHVIMREEGSGTRKEARKQLKRAGIIKLNTNENPYPPAPGVKKALEGLEGVQEAVVSHESGTAVVVLNREVADDMLKKAVEEKDYKVITVSGNEYSDV